MAGEQEHPRTFGERLEKALHGRSNPWMARALTAAGESVDPTTVGRWRKDEVLPGGRHLTLLPSILEVSGHWLLTGEGPEHYDPAADDQLAAGARRAAGLMLRTIKEISDVYGPPINPQSPGSVGGADVEGRGADILPGVDKNRTGD